MRKLFRYLGETDALVELTELAARSFISSARQSGNVAAFVEEQSCQHHVRVNMGEVDVLIDHLSRSYIVTVYQSAERFLHEFRKEHRALYGKEWVGDADDVDPLTVALRNVAATEIEAEKRLGSDLVSRFQYYRLVRNWIVHTKASDITKPQAAFDRITPYSTECVGQFDSVKAPNRPDELCFDDFVLFSRLTKKLAEKLCRIAEPPADHWLRSFPVNRFKRLEQNPIRMKNAVSGRLRTEYGMDAATAMWIAEEICGSLAQR
jgi:hypothetical protein